MDTIVGLKEVRENIERFARGVQKGRSFIVVRKSKPLFRLSPVKEKEGWEDVIDFEKFKKGGISLRQIQDVIAELFSVELQESIMEAREDYRKGRAIPYSKFRQTRK